MNSSNEQIDVVDTQQVFYDNAYLTEDEGTVRSVRNHGSLHIIELDRTIFYPEGGGQPSDQGEFQGSGRFRVEHVRRDSSGRILHEGKMTATLAVGDRVKSSIKWPRRYKFMKVHGAGHLLHDVLTATHVNLVPTKGGHGEKAFLEYSGLIDPCIQQDLQSNANETVRRNLPIVTRYATYEDISATCRFVSANLPRNKQLRVIQIGNYPPMPDGGVHVRDTGEIGTIVIFSITCSDNKTTIRYGVKNEQ